MARGSLYGSSRSLGRRLFWRGSTPSRRIASIHPVSARSMCLALHFPHVPRWIGAMPSTDLAAVPENSSVHTCAVRVLGWYEYLVPVPPLPCLADTRVDLCAVAEGGSSSAEDSVRARYEYNRRRSPCHSRSHSGGWSPASGSLFSPAGSSSSDESCHLDARCAGGRPIPLLPHAMCTPALRLPKCDTV